MAILQGPPVKGDQGKLYNHYKIELSDSDGLYAVCGRLGYKKDDCENFYHDIDLNADIRRGEADINKIYPGDSFYVPLPPAEINVENTYTTPDRPDDEEEIAEVLFCPTTGIFYLVPWKDWDAFEEEEKNCMAPIKQLHQAYASKDQDKVVKATEKVDHFLADKIKGLGQGAKQSDLTELVRVRGKKYTYIRSNQMRNHWRSYPIDRGGGQNELKELLKSGKIKEALKKELGEKFTKENKVQWLKGEWVEDSLGEWSKEWNKKMKWELPEEYRKDEERNFDAGAQAQILRYTAGYGVDSTFSLKDRKIGLTGELKAEFAAAEGMVKGVGYLPYARGFELKIPSKDGSKEFSCGFVRVSVEVVADAFVGASCVASGSIEFNISDEESRMRMRGGTTEKVRPNGALELSAFAGVRLGGAIKASLEWKNPEKGKKYSTLASIGLEASVSAGAGAGAGVFISFENGRFMFRARASLVLGVGAGGKVAFFVDAKAILELVSFIYTQLRAGNYSYIDFIDPAAFAINGAGLIWYVINGKTLEDSLTESYEEVSAWWRNRQTKKEESEKLAKEVKANPGLPTLWPPEAKGRALWILSETFATSWEEDQEDAIIIVLSWLQSKKEYDRTLEKMINQNDQNLTDTQKTENRGKAEDRILNVLDFSQEDKFKKLRDELPAVAKTSGSTSKNGKI